MINISDVGHVNITNKTVFCTILNGDAITDKFVVGSEFITNNSIDVVNLLTSKGYLGNNIDSYDVKFSVVEMLSDSVTIFDVNRSRNEFLLSTSELDYNKLDDVFESDVPIFIERNNVNGIVTYIERVNDKIVLASQEGIGSINKTDEVSIYAILFETEPEEFTFVFEEEVKPRVVLEGHTKKDLSNYTASSKDTSSVKSFQDLLTDRNSLDTIDFSNIDEKINYDFTEFENHVRFSSAHSKIASIEEKVEKIRSIDARIAENDNEVGNSLRSELEKIMENFSPYENYVFDQIYKTKTYSEFQTWLENTKDEAELYDLQNEEFILYLFPPDIVESDDVGYFTNFLLLMGEFFDQIWLYIETISNVKERSFHSDYQISSEFVSDVLADMGITNNIFYSEKNIKEFFGGENNFKKISTILSKRLLYDLVYLYKTKGTEKVIREILNIFGVPRGFLDVFKFSDSSKDSEEKISLVEYDWNIFKATTNDLIAGVPSTDLGTDVTVETAFKAESSGNLFYLDANNTIDYTITSGNIQFSVVANGVTIFNSANLPYDPKSWTFVSFTKASDNSGDLYYWQQDNSGFGLKNYNTEAVAWGTNFWSTTFVAFEMFESTEVNLTEFRLFNSVLTQTEAEQHARDFRSVAEQVDSILFRLKAYKPDTDYTLLESRVGSYEVQFTTAVEGSYSIDEFFNFDVVSYIFGEDFNVEDIRIDEYDERPTDLGSKKLSEFKYDDSFGTNDIVGVFLSQSRKANVDIIRRYGNFIEYIPSEFDDNSTFFDNLEEYEDVVAEKYYNDFVYLSIFNLLNESIFDIISNFVPVSADFEYGMLIKNHIFKKNRGYILKKDAESSLNYEMDIGEIKNIRREEDTINRNIFISNEMERPNTFGNKNAFEDDVFINEIEGDNEIGLVFDNKQDMSFSQFYTKKIIKGVKPSSPSDEEYSIIANAGASIIVV